MKFYFYLLLVCLLGLGISLTAVTPTKAQIPPWRENLDCNENLQTYDGIEYCIGLEGRAHIIVVDMHSEEVQFKYIIARGIDRYRVEGLCRDVNVPDYSTGPGCHVPNFPLVYPVVSLINAVSYAGSPAVVINSDYGAMRPGHQTHGPEGFAVVEGQGIDGPEVGDYDDPFSKDPNTNNAVRRPWLAISSERPLQAVLHQFNLDEDDGSKPEWIHTAVGGGPWLMKDGMLAEDEIANCANVLPGSCRPNADQTAIAISQDGRWLFLIVTTGLPTTRDTAIFIEQALSAYNAIKLDGGGSSQLWYGGMPGNSTGEKIVRRGDGRWLSQYFALYAEPGRGIIIDPLPDPSPKPDPDPSPGFLERIWQQLIDWWQDNEVLRLWRELVQNWLELQENIGRSLREWNEFLNNIQDPQWWEQLVINYFMQCCGSMFLPGWVVILLWKCRKNKRKSEYQDFY
jgi:hypothetical protein